MSTAYRLVSAAVVAIVLCVGVARAQAQDPAIGVRSNTTVTASAAADRVRFTSPSTVVQMRLEVYAGNGRKTFDNEIRGGNVIDWLLQDGQARRLSDGSYLCVITTKSLSGRLGQRSGRLTIENTVARLEPLDPAQLTIQQIQAVGPLEENASLTVVNQDENQTATVIAHDGTDGHITRGRGALSFRIGDFFSGKDAEQMRLTAEGNLGIGITNPTVRLDVDGLIRASQGIVFPDGSIQYSASRRTFGPESLRPGQSLKKNGQGKDFETATPDISGTGTTGKISKWSDGPNGVLADSNITESNGAIGINGTPNTNFRLDVNGSVLFRGSNPGFNLVGLRPAGNIWAFQTVDNDGRFRLFGQDNVNPGVERLTISLSTGYFGISNPVPLSKLHIISGTSDLPPRLQSAGSANFGTTFAAGWDFYHGPTAKGYVGVPDASAGIAPGELLLFGGPGTRTSLWAGSSRSVTLDTNGNVGIGTTTPAHRLSIIGGPTWTSNLFTGALELGNAAAIGWQADPGGQRFGIAPASGGLYFFHTASNPGTTGSPANFDLQIGDGGEIHAYGDAQQARDKGGWVKAMVYVESNGIFRCYNSAMTGSAASTPPCGITLTNFTNGGFGIDFGFEVQDRFVSVTPENAAAGGTVYANYAFLGTLNTRTVNVFTVHEQFGVRNQNFMLFVF